MVEHCCPPQICWLHRRDTLFNNQHIHDYPQWHEIRSSLPLDEIILQTGMVTSKSQLKRLRKQGAIKLEGSRLQIGQRVLIILPEKEKEEA